MKLMSWFSDNSPFLVRFDQNEGKYQVLLVDSFDQFHFEFFNQLRGSLI